ncbi:hypothetical protein [Streptomyces sp. 6N106]|uniref:hypothetical protein n=1 Tax=Streptomyces sp. 6N106 TaxID=3457418 RepID=UPI003FCF8C88
MAAPDQEPAAAGARAVITDCDAKLATHRAALETGVGPALVTQWISETQARRARAEAELRTASKGPGVRMSRDEIARLVRSISDLAAVIQQAEAEDKAKIYRQLGLRLTYVPAQATVRAEVTLDPNNDKSPRSTNDRGEMGCRGSRGPHDQSPSVCACNYCRDVLTPRGGDGVGQDRAYAHRG